MGGCSSALLGVGRGAHYDQGPGQDELCHPHAELCPEVEK